MLFNKISVYYFFLFVHQEYKSVNESTCEDSSLQCRDLSSLCNNTNIFVTINNQTGTAAKLCPYTCKKCSRMAKCSEYGRLCQNGAICLDNVNGYGFTCQCPYGYRGALCEFSEFFVVVIVELILILILKVIILNCSFDSRVGIFVYAYIYSCDYVGAK